ncbi:MAG: hypothetical protein LBF62_06345 [Tannerellaceae bacterium]|jgi:hypothetical protein|nr:hypothetical protein [Tannerellaceae bacterium]
MPLRGNLFTALAASGIETAELHGGSYGERGNLYRDVKEKIQAETL